MSSIQVNFVVLCVLIFKKKYLQVVRHIGRQKISKNSEFLQQKSPNNGNLIFKKNDPTRDSIMPDTTMDYMDMSIRQVVDIKKMTSSHAK